MSEEKEIKVNKEAAVELKKEWDQGEGLDPFAAFAPPDPFEAFAKPAEHVSMYLFQEAEQNPKTYDITWDPAVYRIGKVSETEGVIQLEKIEQPEDGVKE